MNRREEIRKAAPVVLFHTGFVDKNNLRENKCFIDGAEWSDEHKHFTEEDAKKIEKLVNEWESWHQPEEGETLADFLNKYWNDK